MATFFARFLLPFGRPRGRLPEGLGSAYDSSPLRLMLSLPFIRLSNRYLTDRLASVTIQIRKCAELGSMRDGTGYEDQERKLTYCDFFSSKVACKLGKGC